jgi:hypothetical protein
VRWKEFHSLARKACLISSNMDFGGVGMSSAMCEVPYSHWFQEFINPMSTHGCPKITMMYGTSIHPRAKSYILTCQETLNLGYRWLSVLNPAHKLPHNLG